MKRICAVLILVALVLSLTMPQGIFAWLFNSLEKQTDLTSYVHKSYFESGDGTSADQFIDGLHATEEGCAFEIKYPIQLYYFAWLQALGYFNAPNEDETGIQQYYFYLSDDLDMTGWVLPPIGTQEYPFVGNFDGNGHTVSNLTVQNVNSTGGTTLTDVPDDSLTGLNIVGFFGVVGEIGNTGSVNGYTYSSAINQVKNFTLDGITIKTDTDQSLIGAIAGYVNGTVSQAAVSDADIVVKNGTSVLGNGITNISDYSLVGYCTDAYKFALNVSKVTAHAPEETQNIIYKNIQGEGAGFGGSIKMHQLYNRLTTIRSSIGGPGTSSTYVSAETVIVDEVEGTVSDPFNVVTSTASFRQRDYNSLAGSYSFSRFSATAEGGTGTSIVYLYGRDTASYTKALTIITKTNRTESGHLISYNGNYLNINGTNDGLSSGNDSGAATGWVTDNGGHLYTYGSDGRMYYLNADTALSVSTSANTVWTWNNNRYSYTYNGMPYYLIYNGGWTVTPEYYFLIGDGKGNYLRYNNGLVNTTDASLASHWTFSSSGTNPSGYVSTTVGNTVYYLRYNNGLTTYTGNNYTANATNWTNNGTSLYNGTHYIRFNGVEWTAENRETLYAIANGANHLNIISANGTTATLGTGTSAADITSDGGYTLWSFSTAGANPSGSVSATVNGVRYYLNDNNGTLTATRNDDTAWVSNGTSVSSGKDYLKYDNGWTIERVNAMAIKSGNYYLNITAANTTDATLGTGNSIATGSVSNHTIWSFSDSGQIYAVANGRTYYLRNNNGTLQATTTDYSGWTVDGGLVHSGDYYLNYSSGWRVSTPEILGYTIDYNGNYLNLTSTSTTTNNPIGTGTSVADLNDNGHTVWTFEDTGTYPSGRMSVKINGTTYYLYGYRNRDNNLRLTAYQYQSNATWSNDNGKLTVRDRYLRYQNGWQHSATNSNNVLNFTPIYGEAPTVSFEAGSAPAVAATSETEPAHSQPIRVNNALTDLTRTQKDVQILTREVRTVSADYPADTYIPLNCVGGTWNAENTSINASEDNTGYIVSGANFHNTDWPNRSGDIRVSEYNMAYITNAVNGNGTGTNFTYNATYDSRLEVITAVNYGDYNGYYRVSDSFNRNNTSINYNISSAVANSRKIDYADLGFKRYNDARNALSETFLNSNKIYGLHFMNADIDKNDCAVVPQAMINGEAISDLEVPRNSIDFFVKRRGFITVFAGTYFTGNNAFFSLHEIVRDSGRDITEIKEISKIYRAVVGRDFIYEYADGTFSSNAARASLAFDMEWMTNPSAFVDNAVYYFEIPVNGGEYALGSVTGKQGAYLFYLDIAANAALAEDKDRTTVTEMFREEKYGVVLPKGVQIVESGETYDSTSPYEFATVQLKSGYSGTYSLVREGNDFYYTQGANNELTYIGGRLNAKTGTGQNVSDYVYYPNGYTVRRLEHIVDMGRDTGNNDYLLVETTDTYDSGGTRTGRTVRVYGDINNSGESDESNLDLIVTFTYNPAGHDNMKTRVVRASSEGGFNIAFDEDVTLLSVTIDSPDVHVNFGDQNASVLITASVATPLTANAFIPSVDMTGTVEKEDEYHNPVYGNELATYLSYYEGSEATVTTSTEYTMAKLDYGNAAQSRSLTYEITLTPGTGVTEVDVYGKRLIDTSYSYTTNVLESDDANEVITSGTVTVTLTSVTINGTPLGTDVTKITVT